MTDLTAPALDSPWVIAAFDGWNDAAESATGVITHLVEEWDAQVLTELDAEEFYDFQVHRPVLRGDDGERTLAWPTATIYVARTPNAPRDLILVHAPEPNMRWRTFCSQVLDIASRAGASTVVTLGALLADVPHTRPIPVSGSADDATTMGRLELRPSTYSGPVGINAALIDQASDRGLATLSLWAAVPHYLQEPPCPKASLALLGALEDALDLPLPQGDLEELSEAWQRGADEAVADEPEIGEYVEELERMTEADDVPEDTGDAIAREFQRYLRRRNPDA